MFRGSSARWTIAWYSLIAVPFSASTCAAPLYYVDVVANIHTLLPTTTLGGGGTYDQSGGTGGLLQQTDYGTTLSHADTVTAFDPIADGIYTDTASASISYLSVDGPSLHVWVQSQGGTLDPYGTVNAYADAQLSWADTLYVTGLPLGTPVLLHITTSLFGSYVISGSASESALVWEPELTQSSIGNVCGPPIGYITQLTGDVTQFKSASVPVIDSVQTIDFCTTVGATLSLAEQLNADAGGDTQWNSDVNASDTASMYIDVLTPGATLTSASGLGYSMPASVPEPSAFLLAGIPLLIGGFYGFRSRMGRRQGN